MEQEQLLTLPEHLSSPPVFSGVPVTRSFVLYLCFKFVDVICPFVLFLLAIGIVLSVLLRYRDSDWPFGIFKLFLNINEELLSFYHWKIAESNLKLQLNLTLSPVYGEEQSH